MNRILFLLFLLPTYVFAQAKQTVGWVEKVRIFPGNIMVQAKLDTGADHSSISASELEDFEKDGKQWIRFTVVDRYGKGSKLELPLQRTALVKRQGAKHQRRPVVRLKLCVGSAFMDTDVNIVDRSNYDFQMLIGRSFLAGNLIIDAANTYTVEPNCKEALKN